MEALISIAKNAAERIRRETGVIHLFSHYDCDGLAAASIFASTFLEMGKRFHLRICKRLTEQIVSELAVAKPQLVIFSDLGSGYLELLERLQCDIIISDHHKITKVWTPPQLLHVNPELVGAPDICGAAVSYLICRELVPAAKLAPLALVGAIGDLSTAAMQLLSEEPGIQKSTGLKMWGRFSRPLHKALELSNELKIPGITGNETAALQLLNEIGINARNGERWRTLTDLSTEEMQRLVDAIVRQRVEKGLDVNGLLGDIWTLPDFPNELSDAAEFSSLLNCCGRLGEPSIGVALCLGGGKALENARGLTKGYRRLLGTYMEKLQNGQLPIRKTENAFYILAGQEVHENLIGTLLSIWSRSEGIVRPVFGFANSEDGIKVSARCGTLKINMSEVISDATKSVDGQSGGHTEAAGATIPAGAEEKFIAQCEQLLSAKRQTTQ